MSLSPLGQGVSNPPNSCAPATEAASAGGCREGEAPGGAMWQRRGQRSHLITRASCPHFHSQTPRGWLLVAVAPWGPWWHWEKPTLLQSPWGRVRAPRQSWGLDRQHREAGGRGRWPSLARGSPHLANALAKRPAGWRARGTPSPRGKLSWFSSSQGRFRRRCRQNAAACGVSVAPWRGQAPRWGPRGGDPGVGRGRAASGASC